jgi:hypothetical protein
MPEYACSRAPVRDRVRWVAGKAVLNRLSARVWDRVSDRVSDRVCDR